MNKETKKILIADDDPDIGTYLSALMNRMGLNYDIIENGQDVYNYLLKNNQTISAILLDKNLPEISGIDIIKKLQDTFKYKLPPIIVITASGGAMDVQEAIDLGVFYYLTKPLNPDVVQSVLSSALRERERQIALADESQRHSASFNMMDIGIFHLRTLPEAEALAVFLSHCFQDRERVVTGLAELLINAVEHGNFEISYDEKTQLINNGTWREEVIRRATLPEYADRCVEVSFRREEKGLFITIRDQGKGFEWKNYLLIDPSRSKDNHGRGIAQANAVSFDRLTFNEKGNEVIAFVSHEKPLEW